MTVAVASHSFIGGRRHDIMRNRLVALIEMYSNIVIRGRWPLVPAFIS